MWCDALQHIYHAVWGWQNFKNWWTLGRVADKMVDCFMRPIRLTLFPQRCRTRQISSITSVWRTAAVTNKLLLRWQAHSFDFIINRYQNSVDQFWLTNWRHQRLTDCWSCRPTPFCCDIFFVVTAVVYSGACNFFHYDRYEHFSVRELNTAYFIRQIFWNSF